MKEKKKKKTQRKEINSKQLGEQSAVLNQNRQRIKVKPKEDLILRI